MCTSSFPPIILEIDGYEMVYDRPDVDYFLPVYVAFTWLSFIGPLIIFMRSFLSASLGAGEFLLIAIHWLLTNIQVKLIPPPNLQVYFT